MENSKILVINAGSSSIKLSLFNKESLELLASGIAERIGLDKGNITIKYKEQKHHFDVNMPNHDIAVEEVYKAMQKIELISDKKEVEYIGFRVVQGGTFFDKTTILDDANIQKVSDCSIYAPLHNPGAVAAMRGFKKVFPDAKLSADFDTAFHTTINKVNATYAIPYELTEKYQIRRYGAHGISHQYITERLEKLLNKDKVTFINLHLGNGASLCAIKDSKSFDTSMGLTPLAGIMMGTRSGDIDPSIHQFIMKQEGISIDEFTDILNKKSGVLGVSGISSDMRDVRDAFRNGDKQAEFTLELYAQKIVDYIASYSNKLGSKLDAIVFTAGIGENDASLRARIMSKITFTKIVINEEQNKQHYDDYLLISDKTSEVPVYAIHTNEELVIAKNALAVHKK
ncbi:acetate/propionate family kinase [Mycoplasma hafezii]|uniref:acetate/propionate family kinase n=1 Tax=Mycoplasma hafezii TaxID=525886 RepID=UPI003CEED727